MRFGGTLEYKGETLIICSPTRSAMMIEYFSVQNNTLDRNVKFSGTTAALRLSSQFRIVFPDEAPDLSLIEDIFV